MQALKDRLQGYWDRADPKVRAAAGERDARITAIVSTGRIQSPSAFSPLRRSRAEARGLTSIASTTPAHSSA